MFFFFGNFRSNCETETQSNVRAMYLFSHSEATDDAASNEINFNLSYFAPTSWFFKRRYLARESERTNQDWQIPRSQKYNCNLCIVGSLSRILWYFRTVYFPFSNSNSKISHFSILTRVPNLAREPIYSARERGLRNEIILFQIKSFEALIYLMKLGVCLFIIVC